MLLIKRQRLGCRGRVSAPTSREVGNSPGWELALVPVFPTGTTDMGLKALSFGPGCLNQVLPGLKK
jgi:hypothetical protein